MKKNLQKNTYSQLVKDITELYDYARRALVEAYWRIGKRIVEQEQQGETNAIYGNHLLARLSEDLSETLGSGFSKRNLYNMRRFYLAHEENLQHAAKLTWTQHVALLPVKNSTARRRLERKIVSQKLSYEQIRQTVQALNQSHSESSIVPPVPVLLWSVFALPSIPTRWSIKPRLNTQGVGSLLTAGSIYGARSHAIRYNSSAKHPIPTLLR